MQATQAVKIKFELEKKNKFDSKSIFFKFVINSQIDIQAQIDTVLVSSVHSALLSSYSKVEIVLIRLTSNNLKNKGRPGIRNRLYETP